MSTPTVFPLRMKEPQAAEYLGVSPNTLNAWRAKKKYGLPYIRFGRSVRYDKKDLDAWLERRKSTDTNAD